MTSGPARSHGATLLERWGDKESWTLPRLLHRQALTAGDRPYLRVGSQPSLTFRETYDEAVAMAGSLRKLGVERGDYVVLMSPTSMTSVFAWFGANLLGAIEVPLNNAYRGRTLIHGVNLTEARRMLVASEFLPVIREVASQLEHLEMILCLDEPSEPSTVPGIELVTMSSLPTSTPPTEDEILAATSYRDTASVLFTSGTTGPAKGVILPHAHVCTFAHSGVDMFDLRETDRIYCFHTLFHATKFLAVVGALVGGCQVTLDTFDPQTWLERLRDSEGTVTIAHGPMLEMILAQPEGQDDADNPLRIAMGAGVSPSLAEEFQRRFDTTLLEGLGMTEAYPISYSRRDEMPTGSCGKPVDDLFEVTLVDPETDEPVETGQSGEITLRPHHSWTMMQGYVGMPDKTVEAWRNLRFHTGDIACLDETGHSISLTAPRTGYVAVRRTSPPTTSRRPLGATPLWQSAQRSASPPGIRMTMTSSSVSYPRRDTCNSIR